MTRRTADPHVRFDEWLLAGAPGEPARDLAVHASVCAGCAARIAALDLLTAVDPGRAPSPPAALGIPEPVAGLGHLARYAAAVLAVALAATSIALVGSRLIDPGGGVGTAGSGVDATPRQAVLGGTGRPSPTPQGETSASATSSAQPSEAQASSAGATPVLQPTPPPAPSSRPATPRPSASGSPSPSIGPTPTGTPSGTPSASPSPTPTPAESPTPTPEPSPVPDDCADGIDNDGDLLIDAADPGCVLDGNEPSA